MMTSATEIQKNNKVKSFKSGVDIYWEHVMYTVSQN